jgi:hypothetical protein
MPYFAGAWRGTTPRYATMILSLEAPTLLRSRLDL